MVTKKEKINWFRVLIVVCAIACVILIVKIAFIYTTNPLGIKIGTITFKVKGDVEKHGDNTYFVEGIFKNISMNPTFNNDSIELIVKVYNEDMELKQTIKKGKNESVFIKEEGKIYVESIFTAHFLEGGTETKYTWLLVELNPKSNDSLNFDITFEPQILE